MSKTEEITPIDHTPEPTDKKISDTDRTAIEGQALREIVFSRRYKQGKVRNWNKNEELYYGKKREATESRANVDLGRMQEFVHTLLSKITDSLQFKFTKRKEAQLKRVQRLNALREVDAENDFWDIKDLVGKKQGIIYGRASYTYSADSEYGYCPHLENIDVYDLLVDPAGGGIDVENMLYWGRYGVVKSKEQLEEGVKSGEYDKTAGQSCIAGSGNNTESTQEETNKMNRMYDQNTIGKKELQSDEKYKFWEWYTTYKGKRYYLLMQATSGRCLKMVPLTDLFSATKRFPLGPWPLLSWAAFPDLTEFWTPSYCDYVREIFMVQNVTVNQTIDNGEALNKPMKVVNVNAIENMAKLKFRKDGIIETKGDYDANRAVQMLTVPAITTTMPLFELLERIQEKASGVTAGAKGTAEEDGKVGIYEGNQQAVADRFKLLNKSYAFMYKRFARLYENGVRDHLTKKIAIELIGPEGIEEEEISRRDIFLKGDDFNVLVEASTNEVMTNESEQNIKINLLNAEQTNAKNTGLQLNPKKAFEIKAKVANFTEDEIKQLLDVSEFGNQEVISEAYRDIESILDGEMIKPNDIANNTYKQIFVDYLGDHAEDMTPKQQGVMIVYIRSLDEVIYKNMARELNQQRIKMMEVQSIQAMNGVAGTEIKNKPITPVVGQQ